jgi:hypothetical protein
MASLAIMLRDRRVTQPVRPSAARNVATESTGRALYVTHGNIVASNGRKSSTLYRK